MGGKLYKYIGPDTISKIFSDELFCSMKCSYPKDFNDPYELFLTIDFNQDPEVIAYYKETIGAIPQYPTTCFSTSPAVMPMWAHYAHNARGIVVEIDEDSLKGFFENAGINNVNYRDEPSENLLDMLERAAVLQKPRHLHMFQQAILHTAYFTKSLCWSYERERRLVVNNSDVIRLGEHMLLQVPSECVSALIIGPRAAPEMKDEMQALAERIGAEYYEMRLGRSSATPYFACSKDESFVHQEGYIQKSLHFCNECKEPALKDIDLCSWCSITADHEEQAAGQNAYRLLQRAGVLEDYLREMAKIGGGKR